MNKKNEIQNSQSAPDSSHSQDDVDNMYKDEMFLTNSYIFTSLSDEPIFVKGCKENVEVAKFFLKNMSTSEEQAKLFYENYKNLSNKEFVEFATKNTLEPYSLLLLIMHMKSEGIAEGVPKGIKANAKKAGDAKSLKNNEVRNYVLQEWNKRIPKNQSKAEFSREIVKKIPLLYEGIYIIARTIETEWLPKKTKENKAL
ncbi:MAG: hypothetical protein Q7T62_06495 [Undibacterium sp.]|nr:hypothetical protein [Undibacterium sp.]